MADFSVSFEGWGNYQYGVSTYGDNYFGLDSLTTSQGEENVESRVLPSGQELSGSIGEESLLVLLSLTGQVLTISQGEEVPNTKVSLTGESATIGIGEENIDVRQLPAAVPATSTLDSPNLYSRIFPSGEVATTGQGEEIPTVIFLPTGEEITSSIGLQALFANKSITGLSATVNIGEENVEVRLFQEGFGTEMSMESTWLEPSTENVVDIWGDISEGTPNTWVDPPVIPVTEWTE